MLGTKVLIAKKMWENQGEMETIGRMILFSFYERQNEINALFDGKNNLPITILLGNPDKKLGKLFVKDIF